MTNRPLAEQILIGLAYTPELYHRLALVVGPPGTGKTGTLAEVAGRLGARRFNLGVELSQRPTGRGSAAF